MQKLKKILQSNYLYYFLFFFLLFFIIIFTIINKKSTDFNNNISNKMVGKVLDYTIEEDKKVIILLGTDKVLVNYYGDESFDYGDVIQVKGVIYEPSNNTVPNSFNYKKYLNNKNIFYIMKSSDIKMISKNSIILYKLKSIIIKRVNKIDTTGYIKTFILGDKSSLSNYKNYQDLGVSHLFAISGMHIGLFSFFILKVFRRYKLKTIILDFFLLIYGFIILFPASILRTIVFLFLKQINDKYNLNVSNIKILFITAFILITLNYKIIYDISFIYSFVCVFGLLYSDHNFDNKIISLLYSSFIAFLFSLPVNLFFFYKINVGSILFNIIYIPFISFIIYPLSLLSFLIPFFNNILSFLVILLEYMTILFSKLSFLNIHISFNYIYFFIYYILLLFVVYNNFKYLFLLLLFLFLIKFSWLFIVDYSIYFFDVGQGDSQLIISPHNNDVVMIDTGGNINNKDFHVSNNIINFMYSKNINAISSLIITHGDYDHMGEAINLVNNFKVEKVIFNCGPYNDLEQELIKVLDKKKIKYYSCIKELNIDKNKLYFLQTKEYDNENDNSNVIYTGLDGYKFMFMGDASSTTEKEILKKYNLPGIDVLKVGHHGSKTSSGKEFINKINPKYSIISVGKNNRYGHPNKEVLENLENSKIYRTDQDGSIMFKIKNNKLKIETCAP